MPSANRLAGVFAALAIAICHPTPGVAQVKAQARSAPTPAWNKGILPISPEVTLDLAGQQKTISCLIEQPVLALFR